MLLDDWFEFPKTAVDKLANQTRTFPIKTILSHDFNHTQEKILDSQIWEFQFTYLEIFTLCLFCNFQFGILRGLGYCNSQLGFEFKLNQTCLGKTKITMWKTYLTNLKLKQSTRFGIMSFPSL